MLTIGQVAEYAGVTVRAIRHYHAKGLLPEPPRDHSGYRSYGAADVVALVKIRTLADAGVPLARVRELLAADDQEFARAVADIDRRLRAEVRERQLHRQRIARLAAGDSLALPPEARAYLDRLRILGFSEAFVEGERDAWILVAARLPDQMPVYMAMKQQQLDHPVVLALYHEIADSITWTEDDPRLAGLADRLVALHEEDFSVEAQDEEELVEEMPAELIELLDSFMLDLVPAAPRLLELIEERGWTGWSQLRRIDEGR